MKNSKQRFGWKYPKKKKIRIVQRFIKLPCIKQTLKMAERQFRYLCLDDDNIQALIDRINGGNLEIILRIPKIFEEEIKTDLTEWDGLILDYRLDGNQEPGGVSYKALSLAQEIRNKITEGEIGKDLPIILCSTDTKVKKLNSDETSNDLFDFRFIKEPGMNTELVRNVLLTLAQGYIQIAQSGKDISAIIRRDISEIDERVFAKFIDSDYPIHEIARYINGLIDDESGILISRDIILARLGLSNEEVSNKLIDTFFNECKYTGIYSYFDRWWMDKVNDRFKEFSKGKALAGLNAIQRVNILKKATELELNCATPIKFCTSNRFWTICEYTKLPLDPTEGFRLLKERIEPLKEPNPSKEPLLVSSEPRFIWSESRYLSLFAIAEKGVLNNREFTLHPSEKQRLESELENLE
jgi:hypothetical protein